MRGKSLVRLSENMNKSALKQIEEEQVPAVLMSPAWLTRQSIDTLADLLEAITEELARRRAMKGGGY